MAKNPIQSGEVLDFTAPMGGVVSGQIVKIGRALVVAQSTAAAGEKFAGVPEGVCRDVPKATGHAFTEGQRVYWDDSAKKITTVAAGNLFAGFAMLDASSGDTVCEFMLCACCGILGDSDADGDPLVGDLADLDTTAKGSAVAAINEVAAQAAKVGGALSTLTTTDKTSIIAAINELVGRVAALEGA